MNEYEAKQMLEDAASRRALWEMLWRAAHAYEKDRPSVTPPPDDVIKEELERILFPKKRKKFLGLF